ncbi:MAG: helix-turn-helix transcriptional regulator [Acidobacteriota bacterium]
MSLRVLRPVKKKQAYFMISVVAKRFEIHPQTLRLYEREGLLKPSRTDGNTRLYSDDDLQRLMVILNLTRELRVNLAGVEIILNMRERMERMQEEVERFVEIMGREMKRRDRNRTTGPGEAMVRSSTAKVVPIKKGK